VRKFSELNNEELKDKDMFNNYSVNNHIFKDGDFVPEKQNNYEKPIKAK